MLPLNIIYPYIQFLEVLNVLRHWNLFFEIYQLAKEGVSLWILIMGYHFLHKIDQLTFFLREKSHRYHTNWLGSKYKVSMCTFCVFCTLWRSTIFSIFCVHVTWCFPSNFLISIFGIWWVFNPTLELLKLRLTFILFSSWVSSTNFSH